MLPAGSAGRILPEGSSEGRPSQRGLSTCLRAGGLRLIPRLTRGPNDPHHRDVDMSVLSPASQPTREFHWHVVARYIVTAFLALAAFLAYFLGYITAPWKLAGVCGGI